MVEYQAMIHHIKLNPSQKDPETRTLLGFSLKETMDEGLWEKEGISVNTLYTITHCCRLPVAFPMTELIKIADNQPISEDFGYSYSLVYEHTPPVEETLLIAPEETPYETELFEGEARKASITTRLRCAKAREKCLAHYGYDCTVCGFNFQKQYGEIGKRFIHVHHLAFLAKGPERRRVDPVEALRPVCPNCHAMLHSRNPEFMIEELQKKIKK
jgi:hypothetical protein